MGETSPCCAPSRAPTAEVAGHAARQRGGDRNDNGVDGPLPGLTDRLLTLRGGSFEMGDDSPLSYPADGESPVKTVVVNDFDIASFAVTNVEFNAFVEDTGFVTDAERIGWSFVFGGLLPDDFPPTRGVVSAPWWRQVMDASWRRPEGPHSDIGERGDHPVVHVSHNDALAFTRWSGTRLPTESEWEYAARAGTSSAFPWGDELEPNGQHLANVFQGDFPSVNTKADGWIGTCPVGSFPPNSFGLYEMIGNVWEWTADRWSVRAPDDTTRYSEDNTEFTLKGGSYLCHASYCRRYRPAARMANTADTSTGNIGFRIAR